MLSFPMVALNRVKDTALAPMIREDQEYSEDLRWMHLAPLCPGIIGV